MIEMQGILPYSPNSSYFITSGARLRLNDTLPERLLRIKECH